jgi:hypothetical protein
MAVHLRITITLKQELETEMGMVTFTYWNIGNLSLFWTACI